MDEMALLREAGSDVAPPTDDALRAGRDRLTAVARPARRWSPRFRRTAAMGLLAGAAAVAAAAITMAQVVAPEGHGSATAAAAEVLRDAAATARSGPPVTPGAYGYTRELVIYPGEEERQCQETWLRRDGSMAAGGAFPERPGGRCDPHRPGRWVPTPRGGDADRRPHADVRTLPTDPSALRERLYSDAAHGRGQNPDDKGPRDQLVFNRIGRLLRMTLPPELRAALFRTLATVPGVDVVRGERDALGRQGIALARSFGDPGDTARVEIILAPGTYRYLGMKAVQDMGAAVPLTRLTALMATAVVTGPFQRP
ncbi:CU044_5270 family protein [Actinomadura nitritigenes]|uniref:CU044_5270 family protein n=1 Tax=Actinomadura nitritigenes TaxID=134602 RepID=UPI003D8B080F